MYRGQNSRFFSEFIKGSDWLYYKYTSFKEGYEELKKLIEKMN